jgi:TonB family protein
MKAVGICLGLALTLAQPAFAQQKKMDRERDGLSGEVYAVREALIYPTRQGAAPAAASAIPESHTTSYYDKNGDLILKLEYDGDRMVTRRTFRHNGPDEVIEKVEDGGWDPSVDVVGPNPPAPKAIRYNLKDDGHGNLIEESLFSEDGSLQDRTEFKRDHQGRLLERNEKTVRPYARTAKTTFKYGDGIEPVSSTWETFPNRFITANYSYEFDSMKNWVKRRTTGAGPDIERTITYYSGDSAQAGQGSPIPGESQSDQLQLRHAPAHPLVIRKSGGVLQSTAIRRVEPAYPVNARAANVTGQVVVEIRIDHKGTVAEATALSGPQELQGAAVDAARQWKFPPTSLSGMLVDVVGAITFNFQM